MGLIGEMLVERGAISAEQLQKGLMASRSGGQRLGTYLVDLGFIDEGSLLEVLAVQQGVPFISEGALLEQLEDLEAPLLPESMLRRLRAVPFRVVRDRVQVAMSSPGDARVIDRIANYTQLHVEPFVASDRTIERAISKSPRLREVEADPAGREDLLTEVVHGDHDVEAWDRLWLPRLRSSSLLQTRSRPKAARVVLVASFPGLEPVGGRPADGGMAADEAEFFGLMGSLSSASEIGEALVTFSNQHLDRVCLFAVHRGRVSGWVGRGLMVEAAAFREIRFAESEPSVLRQLGNEDSLVAPLTAGPINNLLLDVLGSPPPTEVLVAAVRARGRIKAILLADTPGCAVSEQVLAAVTVACRAAGDALGRVLRNRA